MKIQKRDSSLVEFDKERILNAIQKASGSVHQTIENIEQLVQRIMDRLPKEDNTTVHIEQIQDFVEQELMNSGYYHILRHYITYRNEKQKQRDMGILNLKNLSTIQPPFKELGYITYKRTYAREKEEFKDTILRVLIGCQKQLKVGFTNEELQIAYDHFMNLRGSVAGRFLWQLNTETVNRFGLMSLQNCAFCKVDSLRAFTFLKDVLMLGVGCGVNVQRHNVEKIPPVFDKEIHIIRKDTKDADFIIPDSREGWVSFLEHVLEAYFIKGKGFTYSTILIRSAGSPIIGFGGVASGPNILCEGIANICQVLDRRRGKKIRPIDCMDISDIIGSIVVAGNVRRCLPINTMIHTKNGMIPVQEINVGNEVLTSYGVYERVSAVYHQGKQKITKLITGNGSFRCTPNHRMAVMTSDSKIHWKCAKNLKKYDNLITSSIPIIGSHTNLPPYKNKTIPLDTNMAWFLGYYLDLNEDIKETKLYATHFQTAMKIKRNLLMFDPELMVQFYKIPNNCFEIYIKGNSELWEFLSTHFPIYQVPNIIWRGHFHIRKAFLAGVWDSSINKIVQSSSEQWIHSLQVVSYSCGIEMTMKQHKKYFQLKPSNIYSKNILSDIPDLVNKKKFSITIWDRLFKPTQSKFFNTTPFFGLVEEEEFTETFDLTVENEHNFYANGYLTHNSAILVMGDPDDTEYLNAKRWDLGNIPNYRAMSNNSVICNDIHQLPEEFWQGYNGNGEPYGLINLQLAKTQGRLKDNGKYPDVVEGFNPCLTADTLIMTLHGLREIKELLSKRFQTIVDGQEYSSTSNGFWHTGKRPVYKIKLENGMNIKATVNHRFMTRNGWKQVNDLVVYQDSLLLCLGMGDYQWSGKGTEDDGYIVGFLMGNKTYYFSHIPMVSVLLSNNIDPNEFGPINKIQSIYRQYKKKNKQFIFMGKDICYKKYNFSSFLFKEMAKKYNLFGDDDRIHVYEKGSYEFTIGLLQGLFDSAGIIYHNIHDNMSIRLWEEDLDVLISIQRLLLMVGILSTIIGEYELVIQGDVNLMRFKEKIGFLNNEKQLLLSQYQPLGFDENDPYSKIISVDFIGDDDVYDCTIEKIHCFSANGILSHNCAEQGLANFETCCLSEIFLPNIQNYEQLKSVATTLYRICKHSLLLPCHHPETEKIVHENMRMGIGVSGILQSTPMQLEWLDPLYEYLRQYDVEYSKKLGIPNSIKLTTVKPSGTLSLLGGCTPGIHPALYRYYIRRIRIASTNPLVELCRKHGYHVEYQVNFDGTFDTNTMVVEFPCKSAENAILSDDMSAIDQLEVMKKLQTEWSDNSISISCYHTKEELPAIRQWLEKNYNQYVKTVSFILRYDSGFRQMPYESITKEKYDELIQKVRPITSGEIMLDDTDMSMECPSGICPVK